LTLSSSAAGATELASSRGMEVPENFPFKKIVCFGDSITLGVTQSTPDGYGALATVEGYVPKLWRLLEEEYGTGIELVNAGIGGENTREAVDRIDFEIRTHEPDLILLLHGVVDVNNEFPRFPVVRSNLREMMRLSRLRGSEVVAGTYLRLNPDGFRIAGSIHIPRLNDVIRQEAKDMGVRIADHEERFLGDFSGVGPDGLHPNNRGYEIMAETWFEVIKELIDGGGET
jgi:lysophospholipase L1-like esterase